VEKIERHFLNLRPALPWLPFPVELPDVQAKASVSVGLYPKGTMKSGAVLVITISSRVENSKKLSLRTAGSLAKKGGTMPPSSRYALIVKRPMGIIAVLPGESIGTTNVFV
jgi:hypothetical protein